MNEKIGLRLKLNKLLYKYVMNLIIKIETINPVKQDNPNSLEVEKNDILDKLTKILISLNKDIEDGLYPNVFVKNNQVYIFKSSDKLLNELFNKTTFNILQKYILSTSPVIEVKDMNIENISCSEFIYLTTLKENVKNLKPNIFVDYFNITFKNIITNFLNNDITLNPILESKRRVSIKLQNKNISTFNISKNIDYLDLSNNSELTSLIDSSQNTSLKTLNIENTALKYIALNSYKGLEVIEGFKYYDNSPMFVNDFIKIPSLRKLCMIKQMIEGKEVFKTSNISDNLEWLEINTENEIYDDVGSLKHLKIKALTCPKINCPNLESLEVYSVGLDLENVVNYQALKSLKIQYGNNKIDLILNCTNIEHLDLELNLPTDFIFKGLSKLKELVLNITDSNYTFSKDIFSDLTSLTNLHISLGSIKDNIFSKLKNLKELQLIDIDKLPEDIFSELTSLTSLKWKNSKMKSINENLLLKQHLLQNLEISNNRNLTTLPANLFINLYSLKTLDISNNNFYLLDDGLFDSLVNLTSLNLLNYKNLKNANLFRNLFSLRTLTITYVNEFVLENLKNLTKLCFNSNNTTIKYSIFSDLYSLEDLELVGKFIIYKKLFSYIKQLRNLTIDSPLYEDSLVFDDLYNLEYISHKSQHNENRLKAHLLNHNKNLLVYDYNGRDYISRLSHVYCNK